MSQAKRQDPDERAVPACGKDAKLAVPEGAPPRLDPAGADERRGADPRRELVPLRGDGVEARGRYARRAQVLFSGQRLTRGAEGPAFR